MGKIKKKGESGAATNYISRSQAVKKLQISLANFRRLCILKGIYPRDPKNKKKVGKGSTAPKTYYYKKDIQYLLHEPVLDKIREIHAFNRKLSKAIVKKEWSVAKSLESQKPEYRLDHIIKERYPSFVEALRDLDDALSMIFLFSTLPINGVIPAAHIEKCNRLASEFQHYVMASHSLTKVFVSIKGIYYQAHIHGQDITWVAPHAFSQDTPKDVDFRIMATFLELYETLVSFVNFKLYSEINLAYPPKIDESREKAAGGLAAYVIESREDILDSIQRSKASYATTNSTITTATAKPKQKKESEKRLKTLSAKLQNITDTADEDMAENDDDNDNDAMEVTTTDNDLPQLASEPVDASERIPELSRSSEDETTGSGGPSSTSKKSLFSGLYFFLSREIPRPPLEFLIRSFGGNVGWEETSGGGSPYTASDPRITYHIVDRPTVPKVMTEEDVAANGAKVAATAANDGGKPAKAKAAPPAAPSSTEKYVTAADLAKREFVQPQWVFDSANAGRLVKTAGYHVGETLPAHLSPFVSNDASTGDYVPPEAKALAGEEAEENEENAAEDEDEEEDDDEEEDGDDDVEVVDSDDDEAVYQAEMKAEAAGLSLGDYLAKKAREESAGAKKARGQEAAGKDGAAAGKKRKLTAEERDAEEEKELAKSMMSKKNRRLYEQIKFSQQKKANEADKLRQRREEHDKQQRKKKKRNQ